MGKNNFAVPNFPYTKHLLHNLFSPEKKTKKSQLKSNKNGKVESRVNNLEQSLKINL